MWRSKGGDGQNLALYGQENDGVVVSIAKMNLILHNLTNTHIEFGDTLADPLNLEGGRIKQFDRVIANPPFSQNYEASKCQHRERFGYGFAPETGKKADLMFVQHMLASLRRGGRGAVVMPHGVLFRGGKEKEIRQKMLTEGAGVIEAIVGLPPKLFYGTGIPACVLILNKDKPDSLRGKVLFVNADREYGEGKNQNFLRPEDIDKIRAAVDAPQTPIPGYARLVDRQEMERNDWNLNLRRYVDNLPPPAPEDVRAHLHGGVPRAEVAAASPTWEKFGFDPASVLLPRDADYLDFRPHLETRDFLRSQIEADPCVRETLDAMRGHLARWWEEARDDFAQLAPSAPAAGDTRTKEGISAYIAHAGGRLPSMRRALLDSLLRDLVPIGLLDRFQTAGVFVNWWDGIKYDLKTIASLGWSQALIPDPYLVRRFFGSEADEIETLSARLGEAEAALSEAVEAAQTAAEYEPDAEDDGEAAVTVSEMRRQLKAALQDRKASFDFGIQHEIDGLQAALSASDGAEKAVKLAKSALARSHADLALKLEQKCFGATRQAEDLRVCLIRLRPFTDAPTSTKRKASVLDVSAPEHELARVTALLAPVAVLSGMEAKELILEKHHDLVADQLTRYLNAEKRTLLGVFETLWDKYAVNAAALEGERATSMAELQGYLDGLGYAA